MHAFQILPFGKHGSAYPTRSACRGRWLAVSFEVGGGKNVIGFPGAWATRNLSYLVRGPWVKYYSLCTHVFLANNPNTLLNNVLIFLSLYQDFGDHFVPRLCISYRWLYNYWEHLGKSCGWQVPISANSKGSGIKQPIPAVLASLGEAFRACRHHDWHRHAFGISGTCILTTKTSMSSITGPLQRVSNDQQGISSQS